MKIDKSFGYWIKDGSNTEIDDIAYYLFLADFKLKWKSNPCEQVCFRRFHKDGIKKYSYYYSTSIRKIKLEKITNETNN